MIWHCYLWDRFGIFFLSPEFKPPRPLHFDLYGPRTQTIHAYFLSQWYISLCSMGARPPQNRTNSFTPQQSRTTPCGYLNYWPPGYSYFLLETAVYRIGTINYESSEGMAGDMASLVSSLYGLIDRHKGLLLGYTWHGYQINLAIDLHRGLYGACSKQLTKEGNDGALQGASAAFPNSRHPDLIYINFLPLHEFHHISTSNRGNLEVKHGWDFLLEPRPLKPLCLAEQGRVMGGTVVLFPGSRFVLFDLLPYFPP